MQETGDNDNEQKCLLTGSVIMNKTDIYLGGKEVKVHRISGRGTEPFSYLL